MHSEELNKRLNIAQGQLEKVKSMIAQNDTPPKVLQQLIAVRSAMKAVHCFYVADKLNPNSEREPNKDTDFLIKQLGKL